MENTVLSQIFGNTHEEIVNQIRAIQERIDFEVSCILKKKGVNESDVSLIRKQDGTRFYIIIVYKDNIFPQDTIDVTGWMQRINYLNKESSKFVSPEYVTVTEQPEVQNPELNVGGMPNQRVFAEIKKVEPISKQIGLWEKARK